MSISQVKKYCTGLWKPLTQNDELLFLKSNQLLDLTGNIQSMNTGKLSEWFVSYLLKTNNIKYISQPKIDYIDNLTNKKRYLKPDFYIPCKDLFIEVKSRSYWCNGTASEKHAHIPQKYSKLQLTNQYKNSKVLIVFCANEIYIPETIELFDNKTSNNARNYIKDFIILSKKYNVLDWVKCNEIKLLSYLK